MLKKYCTILSIMISLFLIAGCNSKEQEAFSFDGLKVNLTNAKSIGLALMDDDEGDSSAFLSNNLFLTAKADSPDQKYKLVIEDQNGDLQLVNFYNQDNKEVKVPLEAFDVEVEGNYTFVVYFNYTKEDFAHLSSDEEIQESFRRQILMGYHDNRENEISKLSMLLQSPEVEWLEYIVIHNPSGKVFSLSEISNDEELNQTDDTSTPSMNLNVTNMIHNHEQLFIEGDHINFIQNNSILKLSFNDETQELDAEGIQYDSTTNIDIMGINHEGNLMYKNDANQLSLIMNDLINTQSIDIDLYSILKDTELNADTMISNNEDVFAAANIIDITFKNSHYYLFINLLDHIVSVKLNTQFEIVDHSIVKTFLVDGFNKKPIFINDQIVLISNVAIYNFDKETLELDDLAYDEEDIYNLDYQYQILLPNKLFLLQDDKILEYNLETNQLNTIEDQVDSNYDFKLNAITYRSKVSDIASLDKQLILDTGEIIEGNINQPKRTMKSFKPLN